MDGTVNDRGTDPDWYRWCSGQSGGMVAGQARCGSHPADVLEVKPSKACQAHHPRRCSFNEYACSPRGYCSNLCDRHFRYFRCLRMMLCLHELHIILGQSPQRQTQGPNRYLFCRSDFELWRIAIVQACSTMQVRQLAGLRACLGFTQDYQGSVKPKSFLLNMHQHR